MKTACRLVGPSFVRQVIEFGRGLRLLQGVVEVRPYSAPCGTFGRRARLWRLIIPRSLKSCEVSGTCGLSSASAGYGVAHEVPRSQKSRPSARPILHASDALCTVPGIASVKDPNAPVGGDTQAFPRPDACAAFSNVCIREHGAVCNGGSVVSRGCDKPQDLV